MKRKGIKRRTLRGRGCVTVREEQARSSLGDGQARVQAEADDQCSPQTSQQARKDAGDLMERG